MELPKTGELAHRLLNSIGEGVAIADAGGRIVYQNEAAVKITGPAVAEPPAALSVSRGVFLPDGVTPFPAENMSMVRALRGEDAVAEALIRNAHVPDGVVVRSNARPLRSSDGSVEGAVIVFSDLTEQRRAEARHAELLAFIVHDLKSPLAAIMGNAQVLARGAQDPDDIIADIHQTAESMHRMVMDILDIGASEDGALRLTFADVDCGALMIEVVQSMRVRAAEHGVVLSVDEVAPDAWVRADGEILRRVVENLVDNSLKYAPRGSKVSLQVRASTASVEIRVADRGPGVPEALRERIFEKYAAVERDTVRSRHSRGLGLRFCRVAADAHEAKVWVEAREPRGACFVFQLARP